MSSKSFTRLGMSRLVTRVDAGETIEVMVQRVVANACSQKHLGHWYCVTHHMHFENQFDKDDHIRKGKHRMVWICDQHGPEQP